MKRMMIAMGWAALLAANLGFRPAPDTREPTPAIGICFEGTIDSISYAPRIIWVDAKLVYVPKEAKILGAAGDSASADLKPGLTVRACGWLNPDRSITATHVEILAAK